MRFAKSLLVLALPALAYFFLPASVSAASAGCTGAERTFAANGFEVGITDFSPASPTSKLVLVLGPTGGATRIETSYARALCALGIRAAVLDRWTDDNEYNLELEIHDRLYRRAQRAIELVLSHFSETEVGILGTSLGASHAAIASRLQARVRSIFLIVGGAPISSILVNSDQQVLVDGKAKRFERYGFRSVGDYETALRKVIPFEPLEMKPHHPLEVGMAISLADGTVPTEYQMRLRDAWKPSLVLESGFGHIGTILYTWLCRQGQVTKFFADTLTGPRVRAIY